MSEEKEQEQKLPEERAVVRSCSSVSALQGPAISRGRRAAVSGKNRDSGSFIVVGLRPKVAIFRPAAKFAAAAGQGRPALLSASLVRLSCPPLLFAPLVRSLVCPSCLPLSFALLFAPLVRSLVCPSCPPSRPPLLSVLLFVLMFAPCLFFMVPRLSSSLCRR